jgi:hypothetical protein
MIHPWEIGLEILGTVLRETTHEHEALLLHAALVARELLVSSTVSRQDESRTEHAPTNSTSAAAGRP